MWHPQPHTRKKHRPLECHMPHAGKLDTASAISAGVVVMSVGMMTVAVPDPVHCAWTCTEKTVAT